MLILLMLLCQPTPTWTFHDAAEHAGRSVLTFRPIDTADSPLHTLHAADRPAAGTKFGIIPLGHREKSPLYLVWQAKEGVVWIDANRDGRYDAKERHSLQEGKL